MAQGLLDSHIDFFETGGKMANEFNVAGLGERFNALWARRLLPSVVEMDIASIYRRLVDCYCDPVRRYHSPKHVVHCLLEFDRVTDSIGNRDAVEMAIWFHDAVYVPGATDNERKSAELFVRWSERYLAASFVELVHDLILLTIHKDQPETEEECYLLDIDLSSFGIPWNDFVRDSRNVREEQAFLSDEHYYPVHVRFLKSLVDRPRIYHTKHFHQLYETTARDNIARLLNLISSKGTIGT